MTIDWNHSTPLMSPGLRHRAGVGSGLGPLFILFNGGAGHQRHCGRAAAAQDARHRLAPVFPAGMLVAPSPYVVSSARWSRPSTRAGPW